MGKIGEWLGLDKPMRTSKEYGGIDRENFNLPGYDERQSRNLGYQGQVWGRRAPQASENGQFRGQQGQLANILMGQATGQDSLAGEQFRQAADRGVAQQQALAASARPGQGAMAQRIAAQNAGNLMQGLAGQRAQASLAERLGASQALGGLLGQARGQDIGLSEFNVGAQQNQQQVNQQGLLGLMGLEQEGAGMQQAGGMGYEGQRTSRYGMDLSVPTKREGLMRAISDSGAAYGTAYGSDRNLKRNIQSGDKDADALLRGLVPYRYEYKEPEKWGTGERLGVMAQDLERSPLGRQAVQNTSEGKMVNTAKLTSALAAGLGRLNERVENVERQRSAAAPRASGAKPAGTDPLADALGAEARWRAQNPEQWKQIGAWQAEKARQVAETRRQESLIPSQLPQNWAASKYKTADEEIDNFTQDPMQRAEMKRSVRDEMGKRWRDIYARELGLK